MANKQTANKAKETKTKAKMANRKVAVEKASTATEQAKVEHNLKLVETGKVLQVEEGKIVDPITGDSVVTPTKDIRYKTTGAALGFEIEDNFKEAKPEAAQYKIKEAHFDYAAKFSEGDEDTIVSAIKGLSGELEDMQGKLACACAGLAYRLQKEGKKSFVLIEKFIEACEPLGKTLSMVRVGAIKQWFEAFSATTIVQVEGEGKVMQFDADKYKAEAVKFGRDAKGWLRSRIAKPWFLFKPERELAEYSFMADLDKFIERAKKMSKKSADPKAAGFKVIDMLGYDELESAASLLKRAARLQQREADIKAQEPTEEPVAA